MTTRLILLMAALIFISSCGESRAAIDIPVSISHVIRGKEVDVVVYNGGAEDAEVDDGLSGYLVGYYQSSSDKERSISHEGFIPSKITLKPRKKYVITLTPDIETDTDKKYSDFDCKYITIVYSITYRKQTYKLQNVIFLRGHEVKF